MAEPALRTETLTMTIDGRPAPIAGTLRRRQSGDRQVFAEAPECTRQQLDAAMTSAAQAYRSWSRDQDLRRSALLRCAEALKANAERARRRSSRKSRASRCRRQWARCTAPPSGSTTPRRSRYRSRSSQDTDANRIEVRRRPLGVVAAITPWNYPLHPRGLEDRARAARRQHGRDQAVALHAALDAQGSARSCASCCRPACSTWSPAATTSAPG